MKREKYFVTLLIVVLCVISLVTDALAEAEHHRLGLRYARLDYSVNKMPLDFRSVPIHSDDDYANEKSWGPIENEKYDHNHWLSVDYAYLWEMNKHWSLGLGVIWIFDPWDNFGDDSRRNYTNAPGTGNRGYGAALTFVSTGVRGLLEFGDGRNDWDALLNFTPQIVLEYAFGKEDDAKLDISLSYHRFVALNGWDRYDKFEIKQEETLAHIYPVSMELLYKFFAIGVSYNLHSLTDFGERAETEIGDFSFSIKLGGAF